MAVSAHIQGHHSSPAVVFDYDPPAVTGGLTLTAIILLHLLCFPSSALTHSLTPHPASVPPLGPAYGGNVVTIHGQNFGYSQDDISRYRNHVSDLSLTHSLIHFPGVHCWSSLHLHESSQHHSCFLHRPAVPVQQGVPVTLLLVDHAYIFHTFDELSSRWREILP